ncbi:unnamed protein product [Oppiella nova]|uniref:Uncharacterized protein n=1 Tax=Oppiella nova TaxID=334625 RepID=A0A7R9M926_9ACAR|nr:unnamed protein product [Oppiella nova]CAG2171922.1 unnamed protein product [Oppiella nova]
MKSILLLVLLSIVNADNNNTNDFDIKDYENVKNSRNFTGKVVLVTGSSTGIGEGIVKLFSILGAKVVVTGRNETQIEKVAQEVQQLSPYGLKPLQVVADLTKNDDLNTLINKTIDTFGKLDVLVNNAGIYPMSPISDANIMQVFDQVFNTDLRAIVHTIHLSLPFMTKTNGTIINISSIAALHPSNPFLAYSSAKAALDMLTKVLALELGPQGIRVNTINPGATQVPSMDLSVDLIKKMVHKITTLTPLERLGQPLDVAKGVAFLASSDAHIKCSAFIAITNVFALQSNDIYDEVRGSRNFTGKVVLVTGSSSGIGEQIVKLFSALGANVVVTGTKDADIQRVVKEAQDLSPQKLKPLGLAADLTKTDELEKLVNETIKTFTKLDVLVNNAGIYLTANLMDKKFWDTFAAYEKIDVTAALQLIQHAVPYLQKTKGSIISISSVIIQRPQKGMLAYELAKECLDMSTRVLSLELAPLIRVNAISPGSVLSHPLNTTDPVAVAQYNKTVKITPLARIGQTSDIAKGVVFLASSDAEFITGQNLVIDGGLNYNMDSNFSNP